MTRTLLTIGLLIVSNAFMTFAWYGHLQFQKLGIFQKTGIAGIILISWMIALFEYVFQVPANRAGYKEFGGPFSMFELKTIQEAISLSVFVLINDLAGFVLIVLAVYVIFKKW